MRKAFRGNRRVAGSWMCAVPMLLLLTACPPQSGYDKVAYREQEELPPPAFPDPPRVIAGIGQTGGGAKLVATNLPEGVTQEMVDQGQELFGTVCTACHGPGGAGTPAGPALNDAEWLNVAGQYPEIVTVITSGVANPVQFPGAMPPKGGGNFDDAQVRALAAYVYALSHQGGA